MSRRPRSAQDVVLEVGSLLSWSPALQAAIAAARKEWDRAGRPSHHFGEENRRDRYYKEAGIRTPPVDPVKKAVREV